MGLLKGGNKREDQAQPYQLKPKRGKKTFIEPPIKQPPSNQKRVKRMKKKLAKLNKKIRHYQQKE